MIRVYSSLGRMSKSETTLNSKVLKVCNSSIVLYFIYEEAKISEFPTRLHHKPNEIN